MSAISKAILGSALCVALGACDAAPGQTVGVSKKRIPGDAAAPALNNLLAAAQQAIDRKDYAAAAQDYQSYLAMQPDDASVHFQLGYTYTALQRPGDAKTEYEKAVSLDPTMQPAYLNLGLTLLESDPNAAIAPLRKAGELAPADAKPKFLLGRALENAGKIPDAIEQYQVAEKTDDKDFDTRFALGRTLLKANRPADAEPEFRAALALRPDSGAVHWGIAQCLREEKKPEGEASELAAYLQSEAGDVAARVERAEALIELGKNDDALAELDKAAAGGTESLDALKLRSKIYTSEKRYRDEAAVLQKAAAVAPQDADIPALLGHVYLEEKDYPNAVNELVIALKMRPDSTDVLGELVAAEFAAKNYPAALKGIDMLAQREELPITSWFVRGASYDQLGRKAEALEAYQKFLQGNKDQNSDMYFEATSRVRALSREVKKR